MRECRSLGLMLISLLVNAETLPSRKHKECAICSCLARPRPRHDGVLVPTTWLGLRISLLHCVRAPQQATERGRVRDKFWEEFSFPSHYQSPASCFFLHILNLLSCIPHSLLIVQTVRSHTKKQAVSCKTARLARCFYLR